MPVAEASSPEERFDYRKSLKTVHSYWFVHKYLPVDRYLVRPPASLVVRAVFKTGLTPNHLTVISFSLAVAAALVFLAGRRSLFPVAGGLSMVSAIFDNADGMLARAKNMTSRYGAFLDLFLDRIADFAVLSGITFGLYRTSSDPRVLILGLLTIGLYFLQVALYYLMNIYSGNPKNGEGAEAKNLAVFLILVLSLIGRPVGVLFGVFTMAVAGTVSKLIRFLRMGRDREAASFR